MEDNPASGPDYDLADRMALSSPEQVRAIGHPLRTTILQLLHERAATVTELAEAVGRGELWGFIRHARISEDQASAFWDRMAELVEEFDRMPRSGETVYGFAVGIYPTDHPTLPR